MPQTRRVWPELVSLESQLERALLSATNYFTLKKISQFVNLEHCALESENRITADKLGYQSSCGGQFLYTSRFCHVLIPGCRFKNQNIHILEVPQCRLDNRAHFLPIESSVAAAERWQSNRHDLVLTNKAHQI